MLTGVVFLIVVLGAPYLAWKGWLRLYPGISLRSDYGIRGGWFGTTVLIERIRSVNSAQGS